MKRLLSFGQGNSKLDRFTDTFSLPSGWTCPGALLCLSKCSRNKGKLTDGPQCQFRCSSAYAETLYTGVRNQRWANLDLLKRCKSVNQTTDLICESMPPKPIKVRPGVSGDFFNQSYFDAWMNVAREYPSTIFYAYTKSIPFWLARRRKLPDNFKLTASYGGKWDHLIRPNGLKSALVVYSPEEAAALGLEIDHDDSHAYGGEKDFALLLHSMQPAGTEACKAYVELKKRGIAGYGDHKAKRVALGVPSPTMGLAKSKKSDKIQTMKHNLRCVGCGKFKALAVSHKKCQYCGEVAYTMPLENPKTAKIPLVTFEYADSKTGQPRWRRVRVVRMDGEKIQGFEVKNSWDSLQQGQFKTFKLGKKLMSAPVMLEFIQ